MADALFVTSITIEIIIAVLATFGNGVVLVAVARFRHLQTVTNYLIASLAMADLLVGMWGIPCVLATNYGLPKHFYGCLLLNSIIIILTNVSIFSLLAVAIERFVAIHSPFFYQQKFTPSVALGLIIVNWILGTLIGLVPLVWNLGWNEADVCAFVFVIDFKYRVWFNFFGFILTPLLIMLVIYIYIFKVVRKQIRLIAEIQIATVSSKVESGTSGSGEVAPDSTLRKELRAAKKFALVIGLFAVSWIPLELMNTVSLLGGRTCLTCVTVAVWLSHLNSALNPLLYAYGNKAVRTAMRGLLLCQPQQVSPETPVTPLSHSVQPPPEASSQLAQD